MKKLIYLMLSSMAILASMSVEAQSSYPGNDFSRQQNTQNLSKINWLHSYSDAVALSQSTSKPILILFTGTGWCPACMKLERDVLTRPEFAQVVGQKFVFLKAEFPDYSESSVMASPFKPLLDRYGVDAFPTMVVVNSNGQQLYVVNYREGGVQMYTQELLQRLNQNTSSSSFAPNR